MRTWTLLVSICAHAVAIGALIVVPIFAATTLPEPRRALTLENIRPIVVPRVPNPVQPQRTQPSARTTSGPITEPKTLPPDTPPDTPSSINDLPEPGSSGNSFADLGVVSSNDLTPPPAPAPHVPLLRVGGGIQPPKRVSYTEPVYPPLAIAARKEGTVILEAVLDETGAVRNVRILRSIPLLDDAAVQAVSKWRFTPTLLNGIPVPVVMTVTVGFTLSK